MDMFYKVILSKEARSDLADAIAWYEEQSTGLGERFLLAFLAVEMLLKKYPHSFGKGFLEFRHRKIKGFPYIVFYTIDDNQKWVHIIAVIHERRNTELLKKR